MNLGKTIPARAPDLSIDPFGLWIRLVAVADSNSKQMARCLDGLPNTAHSLEIASPDRLGMAVLPEPAGRRLPQHHPSILRAFNDSIGGFRLTSQALTGEEIRRPHSPSKPQPQYARRS